MSRINERKANGTFTHPTLAGSFGLGNTICKCGGMNPWKMGIEPEPKTCAHCGESLSEPYKQADLSNLVEESN